MSALSRSRAQWFLNATLAELSEATGIVASRWSRYLSPRQAQRVEPTITTLRTAAERLGFTIPELYSLIEERRAYPVDNRKIKSSKR